MLAKTAFRDRLRRFTRANSGAAAVIFAIALFPIMMGVGAAVDYSAYNQMRTALTTSLDSSTLAVVVSQASGQTAQFTGSQNSIDAQAARAVRAGLKGALGPRVDHVHLHVTASVDSSGAITSQAELSYPTKFMRLVGMRSIQVQALSKVSGPGGPIEVAMALDTTGSMAGAKIDALKAAANSLTDTLFSIPNAASNVKVGVVPFDMHVNVGLTNRNASWLTASNDYSTTSYQCWDTYPNATYTNPVTRTGTCYNDGAPYTCSWTDYTVDYGAPVRTCGNVTDSHWWWGCVGSRNYPLDVQGQADTADAANKVPALYDTGCANALQRLTSTKALVQTAINGLTASGETYIAPGLLWGWRVLSPYAPFADGAAYGGRTRKFLVLMTDGQNTHSPSYPQHWDTNIGDGTCSDVRAANCLTKKTCDAIKAQGITVYAVAFQVTDLTIKGILQGCATSASGYYDSASNADLQAAFTSIGNSITAVRIVR